MGQLEGKVIIVTGAARGQGEAAARHFVEEGARVALGDVLDAEGERVAAALSGAAFYRHHDVSDEGSWTAFVHATLERFGRLDGLLNNAGILHIAPLASIALADYLRVVNVNQVGCLLGMKSVIPALHAAGGGSIVNISSTAGLQGTAGIISYVASKFAIRGMTKTAAIELGALGIRVNAICPGAIDTHMGRGDDFGHIDSSSFFSRMPLGRIGQPIEVARLSAFLLSDASSYCTGAEVLIDGGMLAGANFGGV